MKKVLGLLMAMGLFCSYTLTAFATEGTPAAETPTVSTETPAAASETAPATQTPEQVEAAIINNTHTPYLALGADLSDDQLNTVLTAMGITKADLPNLNVVYITNEQEHQYLDGYIDKSVIGTNALSCVYVKETDAGTGLRVTTRNINYCTINMYRNALLTAGVENADIFVVGPMQISGTAALIGAMQAYENMSGKTLTEAAKMAALEELVTIGEVVDEGDVEDASAIEDLIEYVKAEVIANDLTDLDSIKDIIADAEDKFNITLTEEQKQAIADLMQKIADLDIDPSKLLEQVGDLYDKYGETILADAKEMLDGIFTEEVKQSLWTQIKDFFATLWNAVSGWFTSGGSSEEASE